MWQKFSLKNSIFFLYLLITACNNKTEIIDSLPYYNSPDFTPIFIENKDSVDSNITHRIAKFSFINQNGENITEEMVEDKIHVANFFFTTCGSICPIMTDNMNLVSKKYKSNPDVVILSYSVTPWIDSIPKLRQYADYKNIEDKNWHLLTGNKANIYNLARQSYFAEESLGFTKDSTEFLHTEHFLLVDKNRRIRGIYNGTLKFEVNQLIEDIEILIKE